MMLYPHAVIPNPNVRVIIPASNIKTQALTDVISALLIHDKLSINTVSLLYLIEVFGYRDTVKLLESNAFEIIDDGYFGPMITGRDQSDEWEFMYIATLNTALGEREFFDGLEGDLNARFSSQIGKTKLHKGEINKLLLLAEKYRYEIDDILVTQKISSELEYDLQNEHLRSFLGLNSYDREQIHSDDIFKILRLTNLYRGLAYLDLIEADRILVESKISGVLKAKLSPIFEASNQSTSTDIFKTVMTMKGVPNLGELYLNNILTIEDIIEFRDDFDGRLFRVWFSSTDYHQEEIIRVLLNKNPGKFQGTISKLLRWIIPELVELVNPFVGLAISGIDSFVIDKILAGWHPRMFLDDKLSTRLEKNSQEFERIQKKKRTLELFPNIGRNDRCPCGSGRKFKKCCGK